MRKFCAAANSIIMSGLVSEECAMFLLKKQCLPILMYGAGVWSCTKKIIWQFDACFNNAVRKFIAYKLFESVTGIFCVRGFMMLHVDLQAVRCKLLLFNKV